MLGEHVVQQCLHAACILLGLCHVAIIAGPHHSSIGLRPGHVIDKGSLMVSILRVGLCKMQTSCCHLVPAANFVILLVVKTSFLLRSITHSPNQVAN